MKTNNSKLLISSANHIANLLKLNKSETENIKIVNETFPIKSSIYFLSLINSTSPTDPIRKQILPDIREIEKKTELAMLDPLAENKKQPAPGLIHRYPDRVVLLVTNICAVNCRHCNRKRNWKNNNHIFNLNKCINYLKKHKEIREVILSGGDPLLLSVKRLDEIISKIFNIDNIKVVRIGTRAPVTFPMVVTNDLCKMLKKFPAIWLNTQFNHPREITKESIKACKKIQLAGIPINNQSVLLKEINDTPEIIIELCQKLQEIKVRPYYLFQCDRVVGTEHFWTPIKTGIDIIKNMIGHTAGLCIPRYVIDLPNGEGKIPILPEYIISKNESLYKFKTYTGKIIEFIDITTSTLPKFDN